MRTRAARRKPHERRSLILDGAQGVFAEAGYAGADTAMLARAGGVSAPALYRYFPTKKALFLETLRVSGERLLAGWKQIIEEAEDPIAAMERISTAYDQGSAARTGFMRLWFQALSDTDAPEVREVLETNIAGLTALLQENLVRAQRIGLIAPDVDPAVAAWDFMGVGFTFEVTRLVGLNETLGPELFRDWIRHHLKSIGARRKGVRARRV